MAIKFKWLSLSSSEFAIHPIEQTQCARQWRDAVSPPQWTSFLLSFLPGHSSTWIWAHSWGALPLFSKGEGGSSVGFIHNSRGQNKQLNVISYCYLIYAQFLPQSQANPEFITVSWALNKLTPSLCQDSVRAEQFAFRASTDVSFPLQLFCWQKSNQDTKDCT